MNMEVSTGGQCYKLWGNSFLCAAGWQQLEVTGDQWRMIAKTSPPNYPDGSNIVGLWARLEGL